MKYVVVRANHMKNLILRLRYEIKQEVCNMNNTIDITKNTLFRK